MGYCVLFWIPHFQKTIDSLGQLQRTVTKMLQVLVDMLKKPDMFSLENIELMLA